MVLFESLGVTSEHCEGLAEKQTPAFVSLSLSYLQNCSCMHVRNSWREEKSELNLGRGSSNVEREGSFERGSEFHLDCAQGKKSDP